MHVAVGKTALQIIRAIRHHDLAVDLQAGAHAACDAPRRTLADALGTRKIEVNSHIDLHRFGSVGTFGPGNPLALGVLTQNQRQHRSSLMTRILVKDLPGEAIIIVSPTLAIACPELCVMQLASELDPLKLTLVIMELCGTYAPHPSPADALGPTCHYDAEPVMSLESLAWYAAHVRIRGGRKALTWALDRAMEGAASAAEARMALIMSLPAEEGGYGFDKPTLNHRIDVPDSAHKDVGKDTYYLDAFWPAAMADLECESTEFHLSPEATLALARVRDASADEISEFPSLQQAQQWRRSLITKADADRRRLRDLQYLGILVIPVTSFDLASPSRMDQVAAALARRQAAMAGTPCDDLREAWEAPSSASARIDLFDKLAPKYHRAT